MAPVKEKKVLAVIVLFAVAALALAEGAYVLEKWLERLEEESGALEWERSALTDEIAQIIAQKRLLSGALESLERHVPAVPASRLELYAELQRTAQDEGVEILANRWMDPPFGQTDEGLVTVALRGDYGGVTRTLAAWRGLSIPLRAAELSLRPVSSWGSAVEAEVTIETVLASP